MIAPSGADAGPETPTLTLASGARMPALGLGTWQLPADRAAAAVAHALEVGYRLIDTADDYGNQPQVGEALGSSPIGRDEVFLIGKVEEDEDAHTGARERIERIGVDHLDLCLIHRPPPSGAGERLWEGLIEVRREGLTREIGVSNYAREQIDRLREATGEAPALNQVEWTPFGHSVDLLEHARQAGVVIQAYSPLTRGQRLTDETLSEVGAAHEKTPAQVLLRWCLQLGVGAVPKATLREHREENLDLFDFALDEREMDLLADLNERYSALAGLPYA